MLGGIQRAPDALGTTVYVLAPDFEGSSPSHVLQLMGRAIIDYFWPKLIDGPGQTPTMIFSVRWQGVEMPLPKLHEEPELALLAEAFAAASSGVAAPGVVLEPIASQRPKRLLGRLALVRRPADSVPSPPAEGGAERNGADLYQRRLRRPMRQIAYMRAPNFVVKYVDGPLIPYELAEYAGVFRVEADADAAFAGAEPPTHDDWVPDLLLNAPEKTYVRVALRKVKEAIEAFTAPPPIAAAASRVHSVAGFARLLGGLIPSLSPAVSGQAGPAGRGAGSNEQGRSGTRRSNAGLPTTSFVGEPQIELVDGIASMVARFELTSPSGGTVRLVALPKVLIADGFETEPPQGAQQPSVLKWIDPAGATAASGTASCEIPTPSGTWTLVVSIPPDAMISVELRAEAAE
jgi:hypothetical protein